MALLSISMELSHRREKLATTPMFNVTLQWSSETLGKVAEALSRRWQEIFLVEQFPKFGMSTSSRNSGVIHSGIYYPTNSWKARHCVEGFGSV